jgi:hypothetical protein
MVNPAGFEPASVRYRTRSGSDGIHPLTTWVEQALALKTPEHEFV